MSLRAILKDILKSEIFRLEYNSEVKGYRVKIYSAEKQSYNYYDISSKSISGHSVFQYEPTFGMIKLISINNGTNLATESEIKGNITVDYLLQQSDINSVLDKLDYIYRNKPKEETANV